MSNERINSVEGGNNVQSILSSEVIPPKFDNLPQSQPEGSSFISYSTRNLETVKRLIVDLTRYGVPVWVDQSGLKPGTPDWEQALRDAIRSAKALIFCASPDSRRSLYVKDELNIANMYKRAVYPIWVEGKDGEYIDCVPMGYGSTQYIDLRGDAYEEGVRELAEALGSLMTGVASEDKGTSTAPVILETPSEVPHSERDPNPRNPYKGLKPFTANDTRYFFGREKLIQDLVAMTESSRFLAVVGASGSGKSSVVMAGLLPELQANHADWIILERITPSINPLEALAVTLAKAMPGALVPTIMNAFQHDNTSRSLHQIVEQLGKSRVVVFIDQFEELFTLTADEGERKQFLDLLTTAVNEPNGKLTAVLTIRADFMDRPLHYEHLTQLFDSHSKLIPPMEVNDLRDLIVKPAQLQGLTFDEDLVGDLLFEVRGEEGALPLLEFTLEQLYTQREGNRLTRHAYNAIGRVRGALVNHAEATYQELAKKGERYATLIRALFLRLIEPGATEQDTTRRRVTPSELELADPVESKIMQEIAGVFVDARLLVRDEDTLEVAHEALIRQWERLVNWLRDAREDLRLQKKINADATDWVQRGRNRESARLYREDVLNEAREWARRNAPTADEMGFIDASSELDNERQAQARRMARQNQMLLVGAGIMVVMALIAVILIQSQTNAQLLEEASILQTQANEALAIAGTAGYEAVVMQAQADFQYARATDQQLGAIYPTGLAPEAYYATATVVAESSNWEPVEDTFNGMEMVQVPAGCFWMGSNLESGEQPIHEQCLTEAFWIGKHEVTNEQFGSIGCADTSSEPNQPRNCVTWFEAHDFCQSLGLRLPTEVEWEYVARGPQSRVYPWGNEFESDKVVWDENSDNKTALVGSRPSGASWVGAMDMSGNLWEWVDTPYADYPVDNQYDGDINDSNSRVLRGGSWRYFNTFNLRSSSRNDYTPDYTFNPFGFRCARS